MTTQEINRMTDAEKLEILAGWFDRQYPNDPEPEVQDDLRAIAQSLRQKDAEIERLKDDLATADNILFKQGVTVTKLKQEIAALQARIKELAKGLNDERGRRIEDVKRIKELEGALDAVIHELGVPQPGYIQPVANAYNIAKQTLKGDK